jgi:hypothetical protein
MRVPSSGRQLSSDPPDITAAMSSTRRRKISQCVRQPRQRLDRSASTIVSAHEMMLPALGRLEAGSVSGGRKKAAPQAIHQPAVQPAPGVPGRGSAPAARSVKQANERARAAGFCIPSAKVVRARLEAARAERARSADATDRQQPPQDMG